MNKNSVFTWDALHIVDTSDVQRVRDYVFSDSLPGPMLYQDMIEQRFSSDILQRDIETDYRILVLLEKNKQRIQAIIELFSAKNYEGLYYSKTPPQWGRSSIHILPEALRFTKKICKKLAFPSLSPEYNRLFEYSQFSKKQLKNEKWEESDWFIARI